MTELVLKKPQYRQTTDIYDFECLNFVLTFQPSSQQEAHKMVHEANVKQATAEKQLKEAQGKVCQVVSLGFCTSGGDFHNPLSH